LGIGTVSYTTQSVAVNMTAFNGEPVVDFAASTGASTVVTNTGKIYAFGRASHLIFSNVYTQDQLIPVLVAHNNHIKRPTVKVEAAELTFEFISFLDKDGSVYVAGQTNFLNETAIFAQKLPFHKKFKEISGNLIALSEDGKIYSIGKNERSYIVDAFLNKRFEGDNFDDIKILPRLLESTDVKDDKTFFAISKQGVACGQGNTLSGES